MPPPFRGDSGNDKKDKKSSKKRLCPLGSQCKYRNEYQHQLEFDHTSTSASPDKKRKQQDHDDSASLTVFSGRGHTLRSVSSSSSRQINAHLPYRNKGRSNPSDVIEILDASPVNSSDSVIDLCDTDEEMKSVSSKRAKKVKNSQPWVAVQISEEEQMALAIAESNRAVIRQQDQEYYESLWHDQQKEHQKTMVNRQLDQQQQISSKTSNLVEKNAHGNGRSILDQNFKPPPVSRDSCHEVQTLDCFDDEDERKLPASTKSATNVVHLEEEPSDGKENITKIAFRMPCNYASSQKRIVRKFLNRSSARQLYLFIETLLENASGWKLYQVIGGGEIPDSNEQSLEDLGLVPHGVVLVRLIT
jgi:hypothetical protein